MFIQDITNNYGAELENCINCINEPSVVNDKRNAVTINPYDYYHNRFSGGENGQYSENQTTNATYVNTEELKNSLQIATFESNHAKNNLTDSGIQDGRKTICIPLQVGGSMSFGSSVDDCVIQGYTECYDEIVKSASTKEGTLEENVKNVNLDYSSRQKIDKDAIVDLDANRHNHWNRIINDYLWCLIVLFFVFFCCVTASLLMRQSDMAFKKGRDHEARQWALCSSLCYGIGALSFCLNALKHAIVLDISAKEICIAYDMKSLKKKAKKQMCKNEKLPDIPIIQNDESNLMVVVRDEIMCRSC
ncbi:hypothetical protein CHS0354_007100 [Potamilus streckersoni]|uniref:Uncharacterized protein n=1 Tax=Potamilus streckersoni TaxID=2493646 RepID=A0AAE0WBC3_9BIVA|nr:hypothetical protein CHS0354_007100 [Potamilus streckersoni]